MREILFRGKSIDNGEWVCGTYVVCRGHHYILPYDYDSKFGFDERYSEWVEIDQSTVGQYTGLVDKNGVKIFDGDILDCVDRVVVVYWNKLNGLWDSEFVRYHTGVMLSKGITAVEWKYRTMVIGNVHNKKDI